MDGRYWVSRTCSKWSDDRVAELKRLWANGVTAGEIARIFNRCVYKKSDKVSRSAVLGKVHRLGLPGRTVDTQRPGPTPRISPRPTRKVVTPAPPQRPVTKPEPLKASRDELFVPYEERVGLAGIEDDQCRWPIGDPQIESFHFCNRDKVHGLPYCEHHCRIAYEPPKLRKRRINRVTVRPKLETVDG